MPLRDHFRPPVWQQASWEGFHGGWPMTMCQQLAKLLPEEYSVEPRVHLGTNFELDVNAYEYDQETHPGGWNPRGSATATYSPPSPTVVEELEIVDEYAYEVLVYDQSRGRQLVAAVELVSPGNKDRPEARQAFVSKCSALLQNRVCVSIVDLVTTRNFNLFGELMEGLGSTKSPFAKTSPATYAITCRGRKVHNRPRFEVWAYPLAVGQPLPTLPIWLTDALSVSLELESTYEDTCRTLRIR